MPRLVQTRRVRVFVKVLEFFLQFALFFGRRPGILRRGGRVDVYLLVHEWLL